MPFGADIICKHLAVMSARYAPGRPPLFAGYLAAAVLHLGGLDLVPPTIVCLVRSDTQAPLACSASSSSARWPGRMLPCVRSELLR